METLDIVNPFGAPVYRVPQTSSTMLLAREWAASECPHGTVVIADVQTRGRGRGEGRAWESEEKLNLLMTMVLRREAVLGPLPLLMGLACARAISAANTRLNVKQLADLIRVKWPNDVLLDGKKTAGILCEATPSYLLAGMGVNLNQTVFPESIASKATSLKTLSGVEMDRFHFLEIFLTTVFEELKNKEWKRDIDTQLWKQGETVRFREGMPDTGRAFDAKVMGVANDGGLILLEQGKAGPDTYVAGEILL